jgi:hypothetical protein
MRDRKLENRARGGFTFPSRGVRASWPPNSLCVIFIDHFEPHVNIHTFGRKIRIRILCHDLKGVMSMHVNAWTTGGISKPSGLMFLACFSPSFFVSSLERGGSNAFHTTHTTNLLRSIVSGWLYDWFFGRSSARCNSSQS